MAGWARGVYLVADILFVDNKYLINLPAVDTFVPVSYDISIDLTAVHCTCVHVQDPRSKILSELMKRNRFLSRGTIAPHLVRVRVMYLDASGHIYTRYTSSSQRIGAVLRDMLNGEASWV